MSTKDSVVAVVAVDNFAPRVVAEWLERVVDNTTIRNRNYYSSNYLDFVPVRSE
jgi:hypothetical protein